MMPKAIRVLVVDDEVDVSELFRQKFRREMKEGIVEFDFAHSGEDALAIIGSSEPPAVMLILSDINMPGMNGFELLRVVKDRWPGMPVVMISAYGDSENIRRAMELGAIDLIAKPIDFDALKRKLYELAGRD